MNTLFEKSIRTLELPVVLELLASLAVSDAAKEKCRGLSPVCDLEEAVRLQEAVSYTHLTLPTSDLV